MRYSMIACALICAACSTSAIAADAAAPAPDATMQAAMQKMSTIGAEHAALAKSVGEWDVQETMWMAPGAPPQVSKGHSTIAPTLDGKWFRQDYTGEMMGKPFSGFGLNGFDTISKKYVSVWVDSFSTAMSTMTGTSDDGGKTITYTSHIEMCPMTGGPMSMRYVIANDSADHFTMTCFNTAEGKSEEKSMELVYTRAKKK